METCKGTGCASVLVTKDEQEGLARPAGVGVGWGVWTRCSSKRPGSESMGGGNQATDGMKTPKLRAGRMASGKAETGEGWIGEETKPGGEELGH